jgi:hypothetical protein
VQEGARLFQVEAGNLVIERQVGPSTRYKLKSGADQPHTLWLKHPRQNGAKLIGPPKGTEDNVGAGSAQVHMQVKELELRFREAVRLVRIPARA